jgi:O-antigen ligase
VEGALIETTHNAYLQAFWHGGVIGLSLLLLLLVVAFRQAWLLARQGGDYTVFCMLLFAACTMMTGVDTLIDRPRDQWMLFWLPLALLLSYKTLVRRDRRDLESNGVEQTEL